MRLRIVFTSFFLLFLPQLFAEQSAPEVKARSNIDALQEGAKFSADGGIVYRREDLLAGIDHNLEFLSSPEAVVAYKNFGDPRLSRELVQKSLLRVREILESSTKPDDLRKKMEREFTAFRSSGLDGKGTVKFTGYFQPVYRASKYKKPGFEYPLYRLPGDFNSWEKPHPTRVALEGYDGKGNPDSPLLGYELAYLPTRYEAFMVHVQGSAILEFEDGSSMSVGFAQGTDYPFKGISKSYLQQHKVSWGKLKNYFNEHEEDLNKILSFNNRFIFFKENPSPQPIGSLGVPVIPEHSIATDKIKLPPGALGLIRTSIPTLDPRGRIKMRSVSQLVLDQDAGSAIKGPGRVDIFMGTGSAAQKKASHIYSNGELYYLVLKDPA